MAKGPITPDAPGDAESLHAAELAREAIGLRASDPQGACILWEQVWRLTSHRPQEWRLQCALALLAADRPVLAHDALLEGLGGPDDLPASLLEVYAQTLIRSNRRAEVEQSLDSGPLCELGRASPSARLTALWWTGRIPAARACFEAAFEAATAASDFMFLIDRHALVFEGYDRDRRLFALRDRAESLFSIAHREGATLRLRLALATRDYETFVSVYREAAPGQGRWAWRFQRAYARLSSPDWPQLDAPRVFGIGLSRSGTLSLSLALEDLGYLQGHYSNPFSARMLTGADFSLLDAATDTPVAARFETLYAAYPNARFVWTERDPESWRESFENYFSQWFGRSAGRLKLQGDDAAPSPSRSEEWLRLHHNLYLRHDNLGEAYSAHQARITSFFADKPRGKLLRHNVFEGHGWPELCQFLGCDIPKTAYPWRNRQDGGVERQA